MDLPNIESLKNHKLWLTTVFFFLVQISFLIEKTHTKSKCTATLVHFNGSLPFLNYAHLITTPSLSRFNFLLLHLDKLLSAGLKSFSIMFLFHTGVSCALPTSLPKSV